MFSCIGIYRVFKVLDRDSKIKRNYPKQLLYYLWFIGVKQSEQNKGTGKCILSGLIEESEQLQRPIYLETSMPENVLFYHKFGFETYQQLDFGHTLFLLRRKLSDKFTK